MNQEPIDERDFVSDFRKNNKAGFYRFVKQYDNYMYPIMRAKGYEPKKSKTRTVVFTVGEVSYSRRGYKKNGVWCYPVDEKLGLERYMRHSRELMYQIAKMSTIVSYRKVVQMIDMVYGVFITYSTVLNAVKITTQLFNERDDYRFYDSHDINKKIESEIIYIEGDGVMVKTKEGDRKRTDLAHFVVHTGSKKIGKNRYELQNKRETISTDHSQAKERLIDVLENDYQITKDTLIVTNSDHGHGYTPYTFKEIAKHLGVKRHEHFWDAYHLNKKIDKEMKSFGSDLTHLLYEAVKCHSKKTARTILDTAESMCTDEEAAYQLDEFRKKLLNNFQYTKPAELRGLTYAAIGIMESQHRKVSYRMKRRGMYWSIKGSDTMSRMIILDYQKELRDLFFGDWRDAYEKFQSLPTSASEYLSENSNRLINKTIQKRVSHTKIAQRLR